MSKSETTPKLEISDPFFISPNDSTNSKLVSISLNGNNFNSWKRSMERALNAKNKIGFVNGKIPEPDAKKNPEEYEVYHRCSDMIVTWIQCSVDPKIANSIIFGKSAFSRWTDLNERFAQRNLSRIFELQREIAHCQQDNLSVSAYYTKIKSLSDELAAIDEILLTQSDEQKMMQFLMGLNDSYQAIRGQILLSNPAPSARQAYNSILQEEKQRT